MSEPWHLGIMAAFDVESTGPDPESARIVTACIVHVDGSGQIPPQPQTWVIDPGIPIPPEATAVHGITDDYVKAHGCTPDFGLAEIAWELTRCASTGVPVVAYNACYDLTVLDRETRRNGLGPFWDEFDEAKGVVVDPYVMDKALDPYRRGKRTLSAACEFYRVRLDGAHDSAQDAIAAARVAWRIAQKYPYIGRMAATGLHAWQAAEREKQAASFQDYLRRQGSSEVIDGSWPVKPWSGEAAA